MFKFETITPTSKKGIYEYFIELDKEYSVGDFVDEVLQNYTDNWGYIEVPQKEDWSICSRCKYEFGYLEPEPLSEDILCLKIDSVKARGGWYRMDYCIEVK